MNDPFSLNFKVFLEADGHMADVNKTILKLPKSHAALVKGYKFVVEKGNTLDGKNVGEIDEKKKRIKVAAPWNYPREFTILHEIGHAVWKYLVDNKKRKEWNELVKTARKTNKEGLDQNFEEVFCMIYAQHYVKNKVSKFDHPKLLVFVSKI